MQETFTEEPKTAFSEAEYQTIYKLIRAVRPELLDDTRYSDGVRAGYVEDVGQILREHENGK